MGRDRRRSYVEDFARVALKVRDVVAFVQNKPAAGASSIVEVAGWHLVVVWRAQPQRGLSGVFRCPRCGAGRRSVYLCNGWACRVCLRLPYRSQRVDGSMRAQLQADKIGENLIIDDAGYFHRPFGMHRRTFDRLVARYLWQEEKRVAALTLPIAWLRRHAALAGTKGAPA